MSILNVEHLTHGFGDRAIFEDVSFRLLAGEHIGLVGANGEGKSTFMNIVTGKLMPDEGKVEWAKNVRTGYLDQNSTLQKGMTIESVLKSAFAWLFEQEERMNEICDQLKVFEKSEVAIVFSNYEKVSLGGERCGREVIAPCEVDYPLLLKGNCIGCLTAMYDSALTGKIFFKEIGHEDYVCWLSILKQGYKAQNTNTVTALYRVSDHSVSSNKLKAMRWQWNILRNEMDLPVYKAVYYFIHYAIRAFAKAMR